MSRVLKEGMKTRAAHLHICTSAAQDSDGRIHASQRLLRLSILSGRVELHRPRRWSCFLATQKRRNCSHGRMSNSKSSWPTQPRNQPHNTSLICAGQCARVCGWPSPRPFPIADAGRGSSCLVSRVVCLGMPLTHCPALPCPALPPSHSSIRFRSCTYWRSALSKRPRPLDCVGKRGRTCMSRQLDRGRGSPRRKKASPARTVVHVVQFVQYSYSTVQ